jgi:hypothetical protein
LKSVLKGGCFCNAIYRIKNAKEELKRLSQNGFQNCFQNLYSHWQKCVVAQGDSFEENVAETLYCFVFLRNKVTPEAF